MRPPAGDSGRFVALRRARRRRDDADDVPASLSGTYLAARTADVEKDAESAAGFYRPALEADPDNTYLLERSLILSAASGDIDEAMGFAKTLLQKQPDNHPARLLTAIEEIRDGKISRGGEDARPKRARACSPI